jgi:hypothetical protein
MLKSVCRVRFVRYQGAFAMVLSFGLGSLHDDYVGLAGATPHKKDMW